MKTYKLFLKAEQLAQEEIIKPYKMNEEHYVISLNLLNLECQELAKNNSKQVEEWAKINHKNYSMEFAPVDTIHFSKEEKEKIVNCIDKKQIQGEIYLGENLSVMHHLIDRYKSKVKCIYIDPPYNTRSKKQYVDSMPSEKWLAMMKNRLTIAKEFLSDDGVIFVSIDDNEQARLKLLMDEIFGGGNFVGSIVRKTKSTTNDRKTGFNIQHEECLIFAKNSRNIQLNGEKKDFNKYTNLDNDPNGSWCSDNPSAKSGNEKNNYFPIKNPITGKIDYPPKNTFWRFSKNTIDKHIESGQLKFKTKHKESERGFIWKRYKEKIKSEYQCVNSLFSTTNEYMNQVATKYLNEMLPEGVNFENTKPINFIEKLIECSTNPNDIILDFFAGSGTTTFVAHKMKKKYIGVEVMNQTFFDVMLLRMKYALFGEQGGIFKYYF